MANQANPYDFAPSRKKQENLYQVAKNSTVVLQFQIRLKHVSAPVWRRVLVPDDWSFRGLHAVIQSAFEWQDSKLHSFIFGTKLRIEAAEELELLSSTLYGTEMRSEEMTDITEVFSENERGTYIYDFQENWEHEIIFEKVMPKEPNMIYPCCIKGRGAAPDDDTYVPVEYDQDKINIRLAQLLLHKRKYQYINPYVWQLHTCLRKQRVLELKKMARLHKVRFWSKMRKEELIQALGNDILSSLYEFMYTDQDGPVGDLQLLLYSLAQHKPELPFEPERYTDCMQQKHELMQIITTLIDLGYVFELASLDSKQLPLPMRRRPTEYYPVLVMPIEVKHHCLQAINSNGAESKFHKSMC